MSPLLLGFQFAPRSVLLNMPPMNVAAKTVDGSAGFTTSAAVEGALVLTASHVCPPSVLLMMD